MRGEWAKAKTPVEWLEVFGPDDEDGEPTTYRFNMTFMLSPWGCLFGSGCPGLLNRGVDYERGCCERGVTFLSDEDFENVKNSVAQLTAEDWDFAGEGYDDSWYLTHKGKPYKTKKKRDRCIFANMASAGKSGKSGCAFYALAQRTGQQAPDLMPEICWGVPIFTYEDYDTVRGITTTVVTSSDADDWGGSDDTDEEDGKGYMGWWCMDTPDAFSESNPPFYIGYGYELRKRFGDEVYDALVAEITKRGWDKRRPVSRMAGEVRNEGRPLLPLLIEQRK